MNPEYSRKNVMSKMLGPHSTEIIGTIRRDLFSSDFVFGSATAAFQVEGAATEFGKGPSIWDDWTCNRPDKVLDGSTGDVAINHYYQHKDDVKLMKNIGLEAYRFSISWPRILPGAYLLLEI